MVGRRPRIVPHSGIHREFDQSTDLGQSLAHHRRVGRIDHGIFFAMENPGRQVLDLVRNAARTSLERHQLQRPTLAKNDCDFGILHCNHTSASGAVDSCVTGLQHGDFSDQN